MDQFLCKMIAEVQRQKAAIEKECELLRKLLKPWPQNRTTLEGAAHPEQNKPIEDDDKKDHKENLTLEERKAIEQVNQLIQKAQKTRVSKKTKGSNMKRTSVDGFDLENLKNEIHQSPTSLDKETDPKHDRKTGDGSENKDKSKVQTQTTAPLSGRSQSSASAKMLPNRGLTAHQDSKKNVKAESKTLTQKKGSSVNAIDGKGSIVESRSVSTSNSRPVSSKRPPSSRSSSSTKFVPAHVKAPFKTESFTRVPNRKSLQAFKGNKPISQPSSNTSLRCRPNGYKLLPNIEVRPDHSPASPSDHFESDENLNTNAWGHKEDAKQAESLSCLPDHENRQAESGEDKSGVKTKLQALHDASVPAPVLKHEVNEREPRYMSLRSHGSSLKVPLKLSRLVSLNKVLHDKCCAAKLLKKVSVADPAKVFVERLSNEFETDEELRVRSGALKCLHFHQQMLEVLQSLNLKNIEESASYLTIYRAKRILEFILATFSQLQEETEYYTKIQFGDLKQVPSHCDSNEFDPTEWYHEETGFHRVKQTGNVENELKSSRLWNHLVFNEQFFELQLHLTQLAESEWWNQMSGDSRVSLVQGVHSLMTTCGQHSPAVVENPTFL